MRTTYAFIVMHIIKFRILLVFIIAGFVPVFSQEATLSFTHELNIDFTRNENRKFERAVELLAEAGSGKDR